MASNTLNLTATNRTLTGKSLHRLREKGIVPGVVYGRGIENTLVAVPERELEKVYREAGENTLVNLEIEAGEPRTVLIYDVALDPVKQRLVHVDFYQVRLDEAVKAEVPLEFTGVSPAVKELGGTLVKVLHTLEVEALPQEIPHKIEADVSKLTTFDEQIKIKDLKVAASVKILYSPEEIVARVLPPRTEEELEALEEKVVEDLAKVEGVADKEIEEKEVKAEVEEERKE